MFRYIYGCFNFFQQKGTTIMRRTRRSLIALLLTLAMILSLTACGSKKEDTSAPATESPSAETPAETPALTQIRVGMECAYAPNNWQEDTASELNVPIENLPGFYADGNDVQIARHIAEQLGAELVIVKLGWSGLIEALNQGQIDMIIAGMGDTEERRQAINFSQPYKATEYGLMVNGDSPYATATTLAEFSGASVLGQKDTMLDTVIDQIPGVNHLPAVDSIPNQIARLEQKTCDAIVVNMENTPGYLATNPTFKVIELAEGEEFELGFNGSCVGLRKSDTELLDQVNAALDLLSEEQRAEILAGANERQPK